MGHRTKLSWYCRLWREQCSHDLMALWKCLRAAYGWAKKIYTIVTRTIGELTLYQSVRSSKHPVDRISFWSDPLKYESYFIYIPHSLSSLAPLQITKLPTWFITQYQHGYSNPLTRRYSIIKHRIFNIRSTPPSYAPFLAGVSVSRMAGRYMAITYPILASSA